MKMRNERSFWSGEWKTGSINLPHHTCSRIEEEHTLAHDYRCGRTGSVWIRIRSSSSEQDDLSLSKTWNDTHKQKKKRKQEGSNSHWSFSISHSSFDHPKFLV